jgi:hypothetical protein
MVRADHFRILMRRGIFSSAKHERSVTTSRKGLEIMNASGMLLLRQPSRHNSLREGVRLGIIMASVTWLWVALVDAVSGQPFHTFEALGGIAAFTVMHYLLNIVYGVALVSVIHGAERAPSLMMGVIFGGIILEGGITMVTNILVQTVVGTVGWIGIFGGSLIALAIAITLLAHTHPLAAYVRRAEEEI